jgi:hypothetical protein
MALTPVAVWVFPVRLTEIGDWALGGGTHACLSRVGVFDSAGSQVWLKTKALSCYWHWLSVF